MLIESEAEPAIRCSRHRFENVTGAAISRVENLQETGSPAGMALADLLGRR